MKAKVIQVTLAVLMVMLLGMVVPCLATNNPPTPDVVQVQAKIPILPDALTVKVFKIVPGVIDEQDPTKKPTDTWTDATDIEFGQLEWQDKYKLFFAPCYYAVEVGIQANDVNPYYLTHTANSVVNLSNATANLDGNINVSFVDQLDDTHGNMYLQTSYAGSNGVVFNKGAFKGWLRIYYGIGTSKNDNPGVIGVSVHKLFGDYQGQIIITFSR